MQNERLLKELSEKEFACLDLQLYLNTHPCDKEAITKYNSLVDETQKLREEYEKTIGPLFTSSEAPDENYFSWIEGPWPWQKEFNY